MTFWLLSWLLYAASHSTVFHVKVYNMYKMLGYTFKATVLTKLVFFPRYQHTVLHSLKNFLDINCNAHRNYYYKNLIITPHYEYETRIKFVTHQTTVGTV